MKKIKLIIFTISSVITYFLFHAARASAIIERGNTSAVGGECLLLLVPIIAVLLFDNIELSFMVKNDNRKLKESSKPIIKITSIDSIEEVK